MKKVYVERVVLNILNNTPIVILRSDEGEVLPIVIGIFEAQSILLVLEKAEFPRPLTHDLMKIIIEVLKGKMQRLEIYTLKDNIYYANLVIEVEGKIEKVDCRPSDGIALALRFGAPIFASEDLLESPDIIKYYDSKDFLQSNKLDKPIDKKEVEEFRRIIENLSAKEFWKRIKEE
ncbi:MAG: bifunctional nuclease family protein [Candidatus Omnitrophica bacterium]|nr:bifunctional nuclease family protein [Candidatus Omnitrophota bacterium]MCM8807109.1 bifunctional nuclease family protein [Candidatus Omnitrophota bacterium]